VSGRLPRSLDPLPDESLPGYLLRLAHRLGQAPTRLQQATGLAIPPNAARASTMLALDPETAAAFAHATRLNTAEVTALTLGSLAARYPPVDLARTGRDQRRLVHGLFVRESWVFARFSRYCPHCLTGNGSLIQQHHGGGWNKLWRLPIVFACPTHQRLLAHTCPACGQPALSRGPGAAMIPRGGDSALHPAACRALRPGSRPASGSCGHRLDQAPATKDAHDLAAPLALQYRLLTLLSADKATTISVGGPATSGQYVTDLRILTCLITASWPASRHLVDPADAAGLIDRHVENVQRQISQDHHERRYPRDNALYDKPPADAATAAALLTAAARITDAGSPDSVRDIVAPLLENQPGTRPWVRKFLPGNGYCSPGLQTALGPEVGALHVIKRTGVPHYSTRRRLPPPLPVDFGIQHIPQRPPEPWLDYLDEFTDLKQRLLEHVLVIRLAHATAGGTLIDAATQLGIPRPAADNALRVTHRTLAATSRHEAFDHAVGNLIEHLNTAPGLIDYGQRREALRTWEIPPGQWQELIDGLPGQLIKNRLVPHTHWGDGKRRLASTWAWTELTHGDHIYAPAVRPDLHATRPGGEDVHYVHTRWRHLLRPSPYGHFRQLRERLDPFIRQLGERIDNAQPPHQ
jgi:hypothetical protein